ncbi:MAG: alpha/beta hydrolase [Patescibacteria group bacterium]
MQIIVDDLLTHYELSGKGKLVLVLHGWGDSAKGLSALSNQLAKRYQVLAVDLPGFGGSQPPEDVWDLDNYSKFVSALLDKLKFSQPYAVIGHSNGGALALRALSLGALRPDRLVLLAASGVRNRKSAKRLLLKLLAKTGNVATLWMPERYRQGLRKSLYGAAGSDMLVAPHLQETFKKTVRQDVQADAASIDLPTLLIYGRDDRAVPVVDGEKYHKLIKNSRLEILDDAEHFVHLDQPAKVLQLIEEFLK